MSKSLIKLVDEAILPAFLIIAIKALSISFFNEIFSLSYLYQNLGKAYYQRASDVIFVNTLSDFAVYLFLFGGLVFILIRILFFTDKHTDPAVVLKLSRANRRVFIQTSVELYHVLVIWLIFFLGMSGYVLIKTFIGLESAWEGIAICILSGTLLWVIIKQIEEDIVKKLEVGKHQLI